MDSEYSQHNFRRKLSMIGEQRLLELLKKRGFRLQNQEVRLSAEGQSRDLILDYVMNWKGRSFVVEVKAAQRLAAGLFHWMAYSILALQAARRLKGWEPLLAIYADSIDLRIIQRFKRQISLYAPDLWWIVADAQGNLLAHLPSGDEEEISDVQKPGHSYALRSDPSVFSAPSSLSFNQALPKLSFGDLDQWLLKVLIFARPQAEGWGGPRGPIRNLAQLAKLAAVSPPLVYRWAAAMEHSGYLSKQMGKVPILENLNALLAEWRSRNRLIHNSPIACSPLFAEHADASFHEDFVNRLRHLPDNVLPCALSGHQACRLYRLKHSEARSIHLYFSGEPSVIMKHLQLAESAAPMAPVILLQPRYRRSIFGGVSRVDGVPVCDILQVYLDLYQLPDRGREQADFVRERMLEPLFRIATEPFHGI